MKMQGIVVPVLAASLLMCAPYSGAKDSENASKSAKSDKQQKVELFPKDNRTPSQKNFERNESDVNKEYKRQQEDQRKEAMRDKTHDGLRVRVGKDTSVGGEFNPPGVNVRKTIP